MPKEQSNLETTQEEFLAQVEKEAGLGGQAEETKIPPSVFSFSEALRALGSSPEPALEIEEKSVTPKIPVTSAEPETQVAKPRTPEDIVKDSKSKTNEGSASLAATSEAAETGRSGREETLLQRIKENERRVGELGVSNRPDAPQKRIKITGREITRLNIEREEFERELEEVRQAEADWINNSGKAGQIPQGEVKEDFTTEVKSLATKETTREAEQEAGDSLVEQRNEQRKAEFKERLALQDKALKAIEETRKTSQSTTEKTEREAVKLDEEQAGEIEEETTEADTQEVEEGVEIRESVVAEQEKEVSETSVREAKVVGNEEKLWGKTDFGIEGDMEKRSHALEVWRSARQTEIDKGQETSLTASQLLLLLNNSQLMPEDLTEREKELLKSVGSEERMRLGVKWEQLNLLLGEKKLDYLEEARTRGAKTLQQTKQRVEQIAGRTRKKIETERQARKARKESRFWQEMGIGENDEAKKAVLNQWLRDREQRRSLSFPVLAILLREGKVSVVNLTEEEKTRLREFSDEAEDRYGFDIPELLKEEKETFAEKAKEKAQTFIIEKREKVGREFFERLKGDVQKVVDIWKELPGLWRRDKKLALKAVLAGGVSGAGFGFAGGAAIGATSVVLAGTPLAAVAAGVGISVGVGYVKAKFDSWWLNKHMAKTFTQREKDLEARELTEDEFKKGIDRIEADRKGYMANFITTQVITGIAGGLAGKYLGQRAVESLISKETAKPVIIERRKVEAAVRSEAEPEIRPEVKPEVTPRPRPTTEAPAKIVRPVSKVAPQVTEVARAQKVNVDTLLNTKLEGNTLWGSLEGAVEKVVEANPQDQFITSSFETGVTNTQWTADAICDIITRNGASIPDWQGKTIAQLLERDPEFLRFISQGLTTKDPKKLLELYLKFKRFKASLGI